MFKTSKFLLISILSLFFISASPAITKAYGAASGEIIRLSKTEVNQGNFYTAGSEITIDGEITGDLICAGQNITVNGNIGGDVICAGKTIVINGEVGGDVRAAAEYVSLNNKIGHNVMAFTSTLEVAQNSEINGDVMVAGVIGNFLGNIKGELHGALANALIAGEIGRDVRLKMEKNKDNSASLVLENSAKIGGNLNYESWQEAKIQNQESIIGKINYTNSQLVVEKKNEVMAWLWSSFKSMFGALLIGLVLISLFKNKTKKIVDLMSLHPAASLGYGSVILILGPVLVLILLITIIGIPLAVLTLIAWLIVIILSKVLASLMIGQVLLKKLGKNHESLGLVLILGVLISYLLFAIPVIGWMLSLVAMLWGMGGIWLSFRTK